MPMQIIHQYLYHLLLKYHGTSIPSPWQMLIAVLLQWPLNCQEQIEVASLKSECVTRATSLCPGHSGVGCYKGSLSVPIGKSIVRTGLSFLV